MPAAQATPPIEGRRCTFFSSTDPQVEGSQTGEINGGPYLISGSGTMTCTIQVNASTHAGADACSVTGPETTGFVAAAGTCTYASALEDNVYMCTQIDEGGVTYYWHDNGTTPASGFWTTSNSASCALATSIETPDGAELDPIICPVLALLFPPEGD